MSYYLISYHVYGGIRLNEAWYLLRSFSLVLSHWQSFSCHSDKLIMAPSSRFKRRDSDLSDKPTKPNVLTRSPPSPQISEAKPRPRKPYPVPSNNPANQYTLLEKLGTGSFGTVYKAVHNDTKQIVAIKQIGESIIYN
jgi:hypothetical protein